MSGLSYICEYGDEEESEEENGFKEESHTKIDIKFV